VALDKDEATMAVARRFFQAAGVAHKVCVWGACVRMAGGWFCGAWCFVARSGRRLPAPNWHTHWTMCGA